MPLISPDDVALRTMLKGWARGAKFGYKLGHEFLGIPGGLVVACFGQAFGLIEGTAEGIAREIDEKSVDDLGARIAAASNGAREKARNWLVGPRAA